MNPVRSSDPGDTRRRRRLHTELRESLREMNIQLSLLNQRVGTRVQLRDVDIACLELLARRGPLSPSALARLTGLHPATMTGVLDRLERGGWVDRERDPGDRRGVVVQVRKDRNAEMFRLYSGMNAAMDEIFAGYGEAELELLADFLRRTTDAGRRATEALAAS